MCGKSGDCFHTSHINPTAPWFVLKRGKTPGLAGSQTAPEFTGLYSHRPKSSAPGTFLALVRTRQRQTTWYRSQDTGPSSVVTLQFVATARWMLDFWKAAELSVPDIGWRSEAAGAAGLVTDTPWRSRSKTVLWCHESGWSFTFRSRHWPHWSTVSGLLGGCFSLFFMIWSRSSVLVFSCSWPRFWPP